MIFTFFTGNILKVPVPVSPIRIDMSSFTIFEKNKKKIEINSCFIYRSETDRKSQWPCSKEVQSKSKKDRKSLDHYQSADLR